VCNVFHKSTVAISTSVALSVKRLGVNKDWAQGSDPSICSEQTFIGCSRAWACKGQNRVLAWTNSTGQQ
jgi:hypothetical protein